jgi:serine protease Do
VGFAVPVNLARYVMDALIKDGKVSRGYLGVHLQQELSSALAGKLNLPNTSGALISEVEPASPAAAAGLKEGDFVTELNGRKVSDMRQLRLMVAQLVPGTKVAARLLRDGKELSITVTLGKLPDEVYAHTQQPKLREPVGGLDALEGVEVLNIDPRSRRQLNLPGKLQGALVSSVDPDSNAAEAGLRAGEIIVEIDRHPIASAEQAVQFSEKSNAEQILLRVWSSRGGGMRYLTVDNTKRK